MEQLMTMNQIPPTWLDQSFFEKVIRQMEKDPKAVVHEFKLVPGSKVGDNFLSAVFRGAITFTSKFTKEPKTISTFIKVQLEFPPQLAHLINDVFFKNEMEMYEKVLPEIQSLWTAANDKDILCPRLIYQSREPSPVIVMEDLSVDGFVMNVKTFDDFEVSKRIVRRLAKFHAGTFFLAEEKKWNFKDFNFTFMNDPMASGMIKQVLSGFIEAAKEWQGFERFIPKLEVAKEKFLSKGLEIYKPNTSGFGFNVLNHADFHRKNMLFKNNADKGIDDFCIIDYQICNYATPAIDLIYNLYFFVSRENRKHRRNEIIVAYHEQFVECLNKFGYLKSPPSLIDLQVEMLRNGSLELFVAIVSSMFYFMDFSELAESGVDITSPQLGDSYKVMFQAPKFKEIFSQELPRWCYNGFI